MNIRREFIVSRNAGFGIIQPKLPQQCYQRDFLFHGPCVGRLSLFVQTAFVTHSDAVVVETAGMGADMVYRAADMGDTVAGDVEVIADIGKSAFLLDLAESAARSGNETLFVSLEMSAAELTERLLARRSMATMDNLIDRDLNDETWGDIAAVSNRLERLPLHFWDKPAVTVSKIRGAAATIQNLRLIVVDYLGLMQADRRADSRNLELGQISRDLKNLASYVMLHAARIQEANHGRAAFSAEAPQHPPPRVGAAAGLRTVYGSGDDLRGEMLRRGGRGRTEVDDPRYDE